MENRFPPLPSTPEAAAWIRRADEYRALRRAGQAEDAAGLLETVEEGVELSPPPEELYSGTIIRPDANEPYYRLLLFYRGFRTEEETLHRSSLPGQWTTVAHGVAVLHLVEGRNDAALELLEQVVAEPHWARLGHVAAEADLRRGNVPT